MRAKLEVPERVVFSEGAISIEPDDGDQAGACPSELLGLAALWMLVASAGRRLLNAYQWTW